MANPNASHPDFTGDYVSFTVAKNGRYVFSTDPEKSGFDMVGVREVLIEKFPASEGYTIARHVRPNSGTYTRLEN